MIFFKIINFRYIDGVFLNIEHLHSEAHWYLWNRILILEFKNKNTQFLSSAVERQYLLFTKSIYDQTLIWLFTIELNYSYSPCFLHKLVIFINKLEHLLKFNSSPHYFFLNIFFSRFYLLKNLYKYHMHMLNFKNLMNP